MLVGNNRIREDVFDTSLDEELAPGLGAIVLGEEKALIYTDANQFFARTLLTENMIDILEYIASTLLGHGEKQRKIILLNALFGGGKTHTLITIYHALKNPRSLLQASTENEGLRKKLFDIVSKLEKASQFTTVVVVDGDITKLAPNPVKPLDVGVYKVYTLWGYIAHCLGSYSLLKDFDEKLTPPGADDIAALFKNRRVVILMDELANYLKGLHSSADENVRRYAQAFEAFMEKLAKAVDIVQNTVLVVSIPAEISGNFEVTKIEPGYEAIRSSIENIVRALSRVATFPIAPVQPPNLPAVLRTRLFEAIDKAKAAEIRNVLEREYSRGQEIFDSAAAKSVVDKVFETYPFHPMYISILLEIIANHSQLQKTRDFLRISRAVLRSIVNSGEVFELVMPWHIDLTSDAFRTYLLRGFEGFQQVINEDISGRCQRYDNPWLAKIVANTLLLKTFVYGGGFLPNYRVYPTAGELAVAVYEPRSFSDKNLLAKHIAEVIDWIKQNLVYVLVDEKSNRIWFTQFITPIKYVEERARSVSDLDSYREIEEMARKLISTPVEKARKGGKQKSVEQAGIFDLELSKASYRCDELDYDAPRYVLYACIDLPQSDYERVAKLEEIVYTTRSGGARRYANTIFVAFPSQKDRILNVLNLVKKYIACKQVSSENIVGFLTRDYRGEDAEIVRRVLSEKLNSYCSTVESNAYLNVLSLFDSLAYPSYTMDEKRNTVKIDRIEGVLETIAASVEKTLKSIKPQKMLTSMDYSTLKYLLNSIGVSLEDVSKTVREIIEYFYTNPKLPIAKSDLIKSAIADGIKSLEIGLQCNDRVFYKRVEPCSTDFDCLSVSTASGDEISDAIIRDECRVLPWKEALLEQMKSLKRFIEGGKVVEHLINYNGSLISVEDVLANIDKYDIYALKNSPLLRRELKVSVRLVPDYKEVDVGSGEVVEEKLMIDRIGPFAGEIGIQTDKGVVEPVKLLIDDKTSRASIVWRFKAPEESGFHEARILVVDKNGRELARSIIRVRVRGREEAKCGRVLPPEGSKITSVKLRINKRTLAPLDILNRRFSRQLYIRRGKLSYSVRVGDRESSIELLLENIDLIDCIQILTSVLSSLQRLALGETSFLLEIDVKAKTPVTIPSLSDKEKEDMQAFLEEVCLE